MDYDFGPWDSAAYEAERADAIARGHDLERWHCDNDSHVDEWRRSAPYQVRPFRFEDLNGRPEPASWGPCYPKTASASVEKWRAIARGRELSSEEAAAYGQAVHAWIRALNNPAAKRHDIPASDLHYCYSSAKRRAQIRAACAATAGAERRAWCDGKLKSKSVGDEGLTIKQVYARAMAEKRGAAPIGPRAYARLAELGAA